MVATTLSFAIKPVMSEVQIRQSPRPTGRISGTSQPDAAARMLFRESATMLKRRSKLCKNQMTMVAMRMTEKAR